MKVSKEFKVGVLTVIGIIVLILGYNYMKGNDVFLREKRYYAYYQNVDGLTSPNPIFLYGLRIGKIKSIKFVNSNKGNLLVEFHVDRKIEIPQNSVAIITNTDLLGSKAVKLQLSNSKIMAKNGDTLLGKLELSLSETVNTVIGPLKDEAVHLISKADSVLSIFDKILDEGGGQSDLQNSLKDFSRSFANLAVTTNDLKILVHNEKNKVSEILTSFKNIAETLKNNDENIGKMINNFSNISDSLNTAKIKQTIDKLYSTVYEFNQVAQNINRDTNSLGLLLNDPKLYNNLEKTLSDLDKLIVDLRKNPKKYVNISVFGGTDKKKKKKKKKRKN